MPDGAAATVRVANILGDCGAMTILGDCGSTRTLELNMVTLACDLGLDISTVEDRMEYGGVVPETMLRGLPACIYCTRIRAEDTGVAWAVGDAPIVTILGLG